MTAKETTHLLRFVSLFYSERNESLTGIIVDAHAPRRISFCFVSDGIYSDSFELLSGETFDTTS